MKKILFGISIFFASAFGPAANALDIQVAPLALQSGVEVMGIRAAADGKNAIILAGKAAQSVAYAAGYAFNAAAEMIILTGAEVDLLVIEAARGTYKVGKAVFIASEKLTKAALELAVDGVRGGVRVVKWTARAAGKTSLVVLKTLRLGLRTGVILVADTGILVLEAGSLVLESMVGVIEYLVP